MNMIPIFFWIFLVLLALNAFIPFTAPYRARAETVLIVILLLLIGLSVFQNPLR